MKHTNLSPPMTPNPGEDFKKLVVYILRIYFTYEHYIAGAILLIFFLSFTLVILYKINKSVATS